MSELITWAPEGPRRVVDGGLAMRRALLGYRFRAPGEHDPDRAPLLDLRHRRIERQDLRIHRQLAQAARNQLRELRAEIENNDGLM